VQLYDSKAQELRELRPIKPGQVSIYVCGPTVQSEPHIGHLRSALVYDLLSRWLQHKGFKVTLIRNVTDIDDKVLEKHTEETSWWELAYKNELEFQRQFDALGIQRPSNEPRATGHIPEILQLIQRLVEKGFAYKAANGDVYFDTAAWADYGELTNQRPDDMEGEGSTEFKKSSTDFALWKAQKDTEPESAVWPSGFGGGRPGWHIECSAMAEKYLGSNFDIHGGGLDLRFPHHENELAQSRAAGSQFANLWMHNGLVTVEGSKMSKSAGNSVFGAELLDSHPAEVLRYYLLSAHYRSVLDYQQSSLDEAASAMERIEGFIQRATRKLEDSLYSVEPSIPEEFDAAMEDDLNLPAALAVLHERVRDGNLALDEQRLRDVAASLGEARAMLEVLGIEFRVESTGAEMTALGYLVEQQIALRAQARENRDFDLADQIRNKLLTIGVTLSDDADGTTWSIDG
jgi:cysteinyl-tRNA synthetase